MCPDEGAGQIVTVQQVTDALKLGNSSDIGNVTDVSKFHSGEIKSSLKSGSACCHSVQIFFTLELAVEKYKDIRTVIITVFVWV